MGFICFGLCSIVAGMLTVDARDTPTTRDAWDVFSLLLTISGVVAVVIGMEVQVDDVNRGDP